MSLKDSLYENLILFFYKKYKQGWILSENNYYKNINLLNKKFFFENEFIEPDCRGKISIIKK